MNKKIVQISAVVGAVFLFTGCTTINVVNTTNGPVFVKVKTPDSSGYQVQKLGPQGSVSLVSWVGGTFSAVVVPDQAYTKTLKEIRDELETQMILNATTTDPDAMFALLDQLKSLQTEIKRIEESGSACVGHVGDYGTGGIAVSYDFQQNKYTAVCASGE